MPIESISIAPSSHVLSVAYDEDLLQLFVSFKSGTYRYDKVPGDVARGFADAPSAGKCLNEFIKDQYEFARV